MSTNHSGKEPLRIPGSEKPLQFPAGIGFETDTFWCQLFEQDVRTFRKMVVRVNIPHAHWGNRMLVQAADISAYLVQHLLKGKTNGRTKGKKPPRKR